MRLGLVLGHSQPMQPHGFHKCLPAPIPETNPLPPPHRPTATEPPLMLGTKQLAAKPHRIAAADIPLFLRQHPATDSTMGRLLLITSHQSPARDS